MEGQRSPRALAVLTLVGVAAGVAVVGIVGLVTARHRDGGTSSRLTAEGEGAETSAALEARVRQLEARVRALEAAPRPPGEPTPADTTEPTAVGEVAVGPPAPGHPSEKDDEVSDSPPTALFDEVEIRLAAESRDPNWSTGAEERLRDYAHVVPGGFAVESARCGHSLCRVDVHLGQGVPGKSPLEPFLTAAAGFMPEALVRSGEQKGRAIVYFARQAGALPSASDTVAAVAQ